MERTLALNQDNIKYQLTMACLFILRNVPKKALLTIQKLLLFDKLNNLYNLFASFIYEKILNDKKMAKKHLVLDIM